MRTDQKGLWFLLVSFLVSAICLAQQRTISGRVTAADGTPLSNVTVTVKGTTTATATNNQGEYAIQANNGQILIFTMVGSQPQELRIGSGSVLNVALNRNETSLDEVVVVGYGTQRNRNVTGSVASVSPKTLSNRPIADVGRGLQGAAAGLSIVIPSGEVGSDPIIKLRGQMGSFRGGSSPLILLDNVEIPSIQVVNPEDIASITLLKDAASASIYGAKAAFGVVLITTKKGSGTSKPTVSYSNNFSWQNAWKDLEMGTINALKYTIDAAERIGNFSPTGAFWYVDRASYNKAVEWQNKYGGTIGPNDPVVYGRDWMVQPGSTRKMGFRTFNSYDHMVAEWAPTQTHNVSIGQTVGKTSFNIGLGYLNQSGMMKPAKSDEFSRYNASLRVSSEINKFITVRAGSMYSRRNKEYAYITNSTTADPWLYLYRWSSIYPFGTDQNGDPIRSPASEAAAANTANILNNYMNVSAGTTLNFTKNWKLDFDYTYTNQEDLWKRPGTRYTARDSWVAAVVRKNENGDTLYVDTTGATVPKTATGAMPAYDLPLQTYTAAGGNPDHIFRQAGNFNSSTINAYTTYDLNFREDHHFKFILGLNRVASSYEYQTSYNASLTDITNPQFPYAVGVLPSISGDKTWESQLGYFGRINYGYKNRYLLEGNLRYDGSSKFPKDLWWRWYPSVSAGWVVTEENFMKGISSTVNFMKLRGSWGSIGDQTVPNSLYLATMGSGLTNWISGTSRAPFVGTPASIESNITWQDIVTQNFGVDLGFLNNRVQLTFDIYKRNTNNMIVPLEGIPLTFGTGAPQGNFGSLETKGWEFTAEFNHRFDNGLGVNLRGNISDAITKIKEYGSATTLNSNYNGRSVGEIWGYRTDRLYQKEDFELDASGNLQLITLTADDVAAKYVGRKANKLKPGPKGEKPVYQVFLQNSSNFFFGPGDVKFKDINGDGNLDNGSNSLTDRGDLEKIGNSTPRYEYGFRLGADFKGFDISAFFQGVGKRSIWGDGTLVIPGYHSGDGAMPSAIADNYWTEDHTDAFYPRAWNMAATNTGNNMQIQDRYLLNMSYLRLKNLTLGYTLPATLMQKVSVKSLRVYGALENYITWDKLGGLPVDPESISGYSMWNTSNYNLGRTGFGVPGFKSASVGLQLNF